MLSREESNQRQSVCLSTISQVHCLHIIKKADSIYEFVPSSPPIQVLPTFVKNLVHIIVYQFLPTVSVQLCFKRRGVTSLAQT